MIANTALYNSGVITCVLSTVLKFFSDAPKANVSDATICRKTKKKKKKRRQNNNHILNKISTYECL